ncbi:MAG: hypothetical protein H6574_23805 [Lewinellaceae bacterium]|nr:hypothetical protein [Lewinellaceae bacterium]
MKKNNALLTNILMAVAVLFGVSAYAQDDLYYDPATDAGYTPTNNNNDNYREEGNITKPYRDDDYYYEDDDYAYEYSSRIRRFHRPVQVIDYYDPFFVDMWFYDPFYTPGASIYVGGYNDYWRWRRWNRWQRRNAWAFGFYGPSWSIGYNPWGWGSSWGYNSAWSNPYVYNNYYYDPYWTWNGYNPYYCPGNVWVNNSYYYNNTGNSHPNGYSPKTYTGVRRSGTTVNPGYAAISSPNTTKPGRLVAPGKSPTIELQSRPSGRAVSNTIDNAPTSRVGERSGATGERPTTAPGRTRTNPEVESNGRTTTPQTTRRTTTPPRTREVTPSNERPSRDVTPNTEPRPNRRDDNATPQRDEPRTTPATTPTPRREENRSTTRRAETPSRRETPSSYNRSSNERPSRRAEPTYNQPSRSNDSGNNRSYQPSPSNNNRSSSGSSTRSGGSERSSNSKSSSSQSSGKRGRGNE